MHRMKQRILLLFAIALIAPILAACGPGGGGKTVNIGWIPWDEDIAATYLWQHILEGEGYTVNLTQLDAGTVYAGMAQGDVDVFLDAWLPTTHETYWSQYGDQLEQIGVWYEPAILAFAVPDYVEAQSIGDLANNADKYNSQVIGIEPGAGMMGIAREDVMPGYGLDGWTLVEGSTPAMLAELDRAINAQEPIVVTLWQPHWAYAAYPIRNLEDPQNLWGEPEQIFVVGRQGFSEDFSELAGWLKNFKMNDQQLGTLEVKIREAGGGNEAQAVEEWLQEGNNQQLVDSWISG